jgi:hypothetical protein
MPDPDSAASLLTPGPAADPDPVARHAAELRSRVAEHLTAGEPFRAAVWVTRAPGRPVAPAAEGGRRGVLHGDPQSNAAHLDRHVPAPPAARVLALTGDRLIALAPPAPDRGGRLTAGLRAVRELLRSGPAPAGTPPLTPLWECPRGALATASEHDGRLHLVFADGSGLILLTPAELARPFVRAAS